MKHSTKLIFCILFATGLISCRQDTAKPGAQREKYKDLGGITLDSEIPGSEVYFGGKRIGVVPVSLSAAVLKRLGVPNPRLDTNSWLASSPNSVFVDTLNKGQSEGFEFVAPIQVRSDYVSVQTKWGMRTRLIGASGDQDHNKFIQVRFDSVFYELVRNSLGLKMEVVDMSAPTGPWKLKAVLSNHSTNVIKGFEPMMSVSSRMKLGENGYGSGNHNEIKLPPEWASINPGQSLETNIDFIPDTEKGDYDFAIGFYLFKNSSRNALSGWGAIYSPERKPFTVK